MSNASDPAFPVIIRNEREGWSDQHGGITKREYFAAMAMQGVLARNEFTIEATAQEAVKQADALLAELAKEKQQ